MSNFSSKLFSLFYFLSCFMQSKGLLWPFVPSPITNLLLAGGAEAFLELEFLDSFFLAN